MASTKWKKIDSNEEEDKKKLIIAGIRHQLLLLLRRRHRLFPFVSAFSGCLLVLLFISFSLLSPPPLNQHHPNLSRIGEPEESNPISETPFQVPQVKTVISDRDLWTSSLSSFYHACSNASYGFQAADKKTQPGRYILIVTSGGLNQQRTGIIDAVVAAYILNATLVVPKLDQKSYWKDSSNFEEIFDVDRFISYLAKDVKIIKELPSNAVKATARLYSMRVPRKCNKTCYLNRVLPILKKKQVIQLSKFDYRLSNRLESALQKLRCRVNYHALRFTDPIQEMGRLLVERMRTRSKHFVALHLRFEPDMLAFSGCYYGGGDKERQELGAIRKRWKSLHNPNPDKVRRHGRCPLTPHEIGLMLRALGYGSDVHLYVASGEVYGGERTLAPLKALFPNFHSKETLASKDELAPFATFSSRMAALDFIVCDESDAFVANNNGNMARILAGRRRYFDHKVTIRPNAKKLNKLLLDRNNMTWEEFSSKVKTSQIGFMGEPDEVKPGRGEFHENPSACICQNSKAKPKTGLTPGQNMIGQTQPSQDELNVDKDNSDSDNEQDLSDSDYTESGSGSSEPDFESSSLLETGPPDMEEIFL